MYKKVKLEKTKDITHNFHKTTMAIVPQILQNA